MTTRDSAPVGAPCWTDLWTSDVEGSRRFYSELFGWEAQEPSPEFGGYFIFDRHGAGVAGGMGDMGDMKADNTWKIYLTSDDIERTVKVAEANGAQILGPPMAVADLGLQTVMVDPTGATVGVWQPGTFPGFTTLNEHGAPSWFELHTRDDQRAISFYRTVFGLETNPVGDTDEFRYTLVRNPSGTEDLAGIMDARPFLPDGAPSHWSVYWEVDDVAATVARVSQLGGTLVAGPEASPYGVLATVADPAGAEFKLRTSP